MGPVKDPTPCRNSWKSMQKNTMKVTYSNQGVPLPMNITYRELIKFLGNIPAKRLDDNVTVYDNENDEYYPVENTFITKENDVLDKGHFVLKIKSA
jgi:hypothetical protein